MVGWVDQGGQQASNHKPISGHEVLLHAPSRRGWKYSLPAAHRCGLLEREFDAMKTFRRADRTTTTLPTTSVWGKLGYENYPTYYYLARSQARNWRYPASNSEELRAYLVHPGDSEESLNRRGARDLETLTGRPDEADHLWWPASTASNEPVKGTSRRLIGGIQASWGGSEGITCQSDEDSTVGDTGQLMRRGGTSLVSGEGGAGRPARNPVCDPLRKTRWACHETLTSNAKRELEVCGELRPYIATELPRGVDLTPSLGSDPWWTWMAGRTTSGRGDYYVARENGCACRCINRWDRSLGRRASDTCLRSKQELPRRERFDWAQPCDDPAGKLG
ncbi:uncharacterized protein BDR25DRAFT_348648 [Lindgomyces ingoldianus]|uniref:Uncharacterized protein n=1 Tax=Lindgomyces ingoldianus TaxID=673940 RepID=A0ACB6RGZ3_9PLEO|nr:uncharacterized protein BDR25DRAFT_348648 [Lindgomyces ingoldianus]KAF2478391.1 hypothetical protein BDR25DRAFT_348648 [Lindgomyces ingoldianus]